MAAKHVATPVLASDGNPAIYKWSEKGHARFNICRKCKHVVQPDRSSERLDPKTEPRWLHWGTAREECK